MTNEEAINLLNRMKASLEPCSTLTDVCRDVYEAIDLAIKALEENERLSLLYSDMANEVARLKSMTGEMCRKR